MGVVANSALAVLLEELAHTWLMQSAQTYAEKRVGDFEI